MRYFSLTGADMLLLNMIAASLLIGITALIAARLARQGSMSTRHGFYCIALVLMLLSPLPIWRLGSRGWGFVPISTMSEDRAAASEVDRAVLSWPTDQPASMPEFTSDAPREAAAPPKSRAGLSVEEPLAQAPQREGADWGSASGSTWWSYARFPLLFAIAWGAVSLWLSARLICGLAVIRRLRRSFRPTRDPRLIAAANRVASVSRPSVPVVESNLAPVPLTLGWWRSVIVMPEGLAALLDDEELECVLAHETAHAVRHDTLIAMLQQLARIGFWWNPLLRVINRQINQLRERICDAYVVQQRGDGLPLARSLVRVAEWSSGAGLTLPLASTLLDGEDDYERRVSRLAAGGSPGAIGLNRWSFALLASFSILLGMISLVPAVRSQAVAASPAAAEPAGPESAGPESTGPQPATEEPATAEPAEADPAAAEPAAEPAQTEWQVRVRAVDAEGKPIANPRVGIQIGGDNPPAWHDGDAGGSFVATIPTRTPRYCYLLVRAAGYAPMRAFWGNIAEQPADPLPAEFTFEMTRAITVGGTVVDEDGQPVAGATVLFSAGVESVNQARRAEVSFYHEEYTTDEKGRWQCALVPQTVDSATINVTHPEFAYDDGNYSQDQRIGELRTLQHRWKLKRGFVVRGRVVDGNGAPIEGATLALCELNTASRKGPFAQTDSDGQYRFERVAPRFNVSDDDPIRFTVAIVKSGFAPGLERVPGFGQRPLADSTKEQRIVNFTLQPGGTVTLLVVDAQDQPVPGAWVLPDEWRGTSALQVLQQFGIPRETDEKGVWKWEHAPLGETVGLDIMKRGYADARRQEVRVDDEPVQRTIVLKRPQYITGTVLDAETREPIADFVVQHAFENVAGYPDGLYWTLDSARGERGAYRKRLTLPPINGSYTYRVLAEGYLPAVSKSIPFAEGETTVNFELQRAR